MWGQIPALTLISPYFVIHKMGLLLVSISEGCPEDARKQCQHCTKFRLAINVATLKSVKQSIKQGKWIEM